MVRIGDRGKPVGSKQRLMPWVVMLSVVLVGGACGSQRSDEDIRAAAQPVVSVGAPSQPLAPGAPGATESPIAASGQPAPILDGASISPAGPGVSNGSSEPPSGVATSQAPAARGRAQAAAGAARTPIPTGGPAGSPGGATPTGSGGAKADAGQAPTDTGPRPGSDAPAPNASGPILLGSVGSYSGIVGASMNGGLVAIQAWVQATKDAGGLNGHPIRLVVGDDGADPARHRQLLQQFVEERGVKAFLFNGAPLSEQAGKDYVTKKRVPVIGGAGGSTIYYESPMYFPQMAQGIALQKAWLAGAAQLFLPAGKKKLGFIACQEAPFCGEITQLWKDYAKQVGFDLVYTARVSLAQPSFTAECVGAKNAGTEIFYIVSDANSFGRAARDCRSVDFNVPYGLVSSVVQDAHRKDPNLDGGFFSTPLVPWFDTTNPELQRYRAVLQRYAPAQTPDGISEVGWVAARVFEAAARNSPDPTTTAGILEGLWSIKDLTIGGLTYPLNYVRDQNAPQKICWAKVVIQNKQWTSPDSGKFSCQ